MRKRVYDPANPTDMAETYYVYEAGGKVVAIYENCVEPAPPGEEPDSDDDGVPDACDPDPNNGEVPPPGGDSDGDGIPDEFDPCPCTAGPEGDQDSDGIPDATDPNPCEPSCAEPYNLVEWVIYGNAAQGRIAEGKPSNISRPASTGTPITEPEETFTRILDEKYYELKDHLGNARVVVSDMKQPTTESGLAPFAAVLSSYANYYPYGMMQPDRSWEGEEWRYGFNGKEMDHELTSQGDSYDYGMRMYNAGVGRFLSVDPLSDKFPWWSPYQFAGNMPIHMIDLDGLEPADPQANSSANGQQIKSTDEPVTGERGLETLRACIHAELNGNSQAPIPAPTPSTLTVTLTRLSQTNTVASALQTEEYVRRNGDAILAAASSGERIVITRNIVRSVPPTVRKVTGLGVTATQRAIQAADNELAAVRLLSKAGKALGVASVGIGVVQVLNGDEAWQKGVLDAAITTAALVGSPVVAVGATIYFIVDATVGWDVVAARIDGALSHLGTTDEMLQTTAQDNSTQLRNPQDVTDVKPRTRGASLDSAYPRRLQDATAVQPIR